MCSWRFCVAGDSVWLVLQVGESPTWFFVPGVCWQFCLITVWTLFLFLVEGISHEQN